MLPEQSAGSPGELASKRKHGTSSQNPVHPLNKSNIFFNPLCPGIRHRGECHFLPFQELKPDRINTARPSPPDPKWFPCCWTGSSQHAWGPPQNSRLRTLPHTLQNVDQKHPEAVTCRPRCWSSPSLLQPLLLRAALAAEQPRKFIPMTAISFQVVAAASRWLSSAGLFLASDSRWAAGISVLGQGGVDHVLVTQACVTQDPPELICHSGAAFVCETACSRTFLLHVL